MRRYTAVLFLVALGVGCSKKTDDAAPVATPTVTLSRGEAAVGAPVDVTYRFAVAANAPTRRLSWPPSGSALA